MSNEQVVSELLESIRSGRLITARTLSVGDVLATLDDRDAPEFEREWMRVFNQIGRTPLDDSAHDGVERLAVEVFTKCYQFPNGDQLAPYVSDDFDLIARAVLLDFDDWWLRRLWNSYLLERFPHGLLDVSEDRGIGQL